MPSKEILASTLAATAILMPHAAIATAQENESPEYYNRSDRSHQSGTACFEQGMGQVAIISRDATYDSQGNIINPRDTEATERLTEHYKQRFGEHAVSVYYFDENGAPEQTGGTEPGSETGTTHDYASFYPTLMEMQADDAEFDITSIAVVGGSNAIHTDLVRIAEQRIDDPENPCDNVHTRRRFAGETRTTTSLVVDEHIAGQNDGTVINYDQRRG
ncbi:TPA: hypothetical protein EYO12_04425 [Candidatus Saccharibacteria bacterium]|nr:hypothetical protein [Candidatus Saccharibacteria bacterium]HIO87719.1 hypothetical protein [Candidatus Saccharibacteria bacterium]